MLGDNESAKPITDQITDTFFDRLSERELFDKVIITKLRDAASKGKLASYKTVIEAITTPEA